jgi:uncharacterized protein (TIGR02145 family)
MTKSLYFLLLLFFPIVLNAQERTLDSLLDARDGRKYRIVQINNTQWFYDNLKFETEASFCPNFSKKEDQCQYGNFYAYQESEKVCPDGWGLPSEQDWFEYLEFRMKSFGGTFSDISIDTLMEEFISLIYVDQIDKMNLFENSNPLGLQSIGWVEGKKLIKKRSTTFWLKHSIIDDKRFHMHVGNSDLVLHRHGHHVNDVKRKARKFLIKCIRSAE